MDFFKILEYIAVPNRDNGEYFTDDRRLTRIENLLWHSKYRKVNPDGLYVLYSAKPLHRITAPVIISSHVDCVPQIRNCFVKKNDDETLSGTFDNLLTNAAVLTLMLNDRLSDNVLVAFTGDEEEDSTGAIHLSRFLTRKKMAAPVIVLDVTDMGWNENADFTIENNFWLDKMGKAVIDAVRNLDCQWKFVPSDPDNIPDYVDGKHIIPIEAEADESWEYDEQGMECFSLCLPVRGEMHSNQGVLAGKQSCIRYMEALSTIARALADRPRGAA